MSYARFGSPVEHSHCFDALESAVAEARKAVRAWLLVDGSTGGNRATGLSFSPGRPNLGDPAGTGFQRCQGRRIYSSAIGRVA